MISLSERSSSAQRSLLVCVTIWLDSCADDVAGWRDLDDPCDLCPARADEKLGVVLAGMALVCSKPSSGRQLTTVAGGQF